MSDSIAKVTVYKIKELLNYDSLAFSGYTLVAEGERQVDDKQFNYKLFFLNHFTKQPQWFGVFSGLDISDEHTPLVRSSGFILVVRLSDSYYAFSGGIGHIRLRAALDIEPRFGAILAGKILTLPELKGLTQKDTSGVVNFVDRAFRGTYNPEGDINNLKRILTHVRGKISDKSSHYEAIGKAIQAGNALTVTGDKTFDEMLSFLTKVDDLWQNGPRIINIPQLRCIEKKFDADLINQLETKLISDICAMPNEDNTLFLDNEEMGYLPDRVVKYELLFDRRHIEYNTYSEVFNAAGRILSCEMDKIAAFHRLRLKVIFDDDNYEKNLLSYFICGDVIFDNEYYFINNKLWYKANDEYITKLNSEIDNIQFITSEDLDLNEWDDNQHSGHDGEFRYNQSNSLYLCLDHKLVNIENERGGIEFCDLLNENDGMVRLLHVKKDCGAALRALFAQGFVSSQLYALDAQFRGKVHNAELRQEGAELTDENKRLLAGLSSKYRNQIEIIYAIHDTKPSHKVPLSPTKTSDWLQGTLTTFAKVDLLDRASSMRAMGYNVAVTRIRPYPIDN